MSCGVCQTYEVIITTARRIGNEEHAQKMERALAEHQAEAHEPKPTDEPVVVWKNGVRWMGLRP